MLLADDQGRYVDANPAACKLLGVELDRLIGRTIADFGVAPPGVDLADQWQVFLAQGHMQGEITLRGVGGESRLAEFSATAHFCPHHHLLILRDVTDRKQAEALQNQLSQVLTQQVAERAEALQVLQTQLETEHALLESIVNTIDGVVWSVDLQTTTTRYINSASATLYGYGAEAFLADHGLWRRITLPEDLPIIDQMYSRLASQASHDVEYRIIHADGDIRWVRDRLRVTYDSEGQPVRIDGIATNITGQKHLEEALRLSEGRLRAIFDQAAIGINQAGLDGYFLQANQAYCDLLGYSEAELLQMRYQDLAHPDEVQSTEAAVDCLLSGEASSVTLKKRYFHKDGSTRWTNLVLSILRDAEGQPISDLAIVQDITDRKRIEQALGEERSLFVNGPTMVVRWGMAHPWPMEYISPNVEAQLGYRADLLTSGQVAFADLIHPDDIDRVHREVDAATAARKDCFVQQYRLRHALGHYRWIDDFTRFIYAPDGTVAQILGYIQDITDRKQSEMQLQDLTQQLQQANAELHRLATTDALTQVANRRYFDQMLAQEWAVAQRDQTPLALIICDVDYFKAYNDHYGHPAGDRCLQQIAQIMNASVQRPGDVLARYGGEEFVVLLPRTTTAGAIAVMTNIQAGLAEADLPHGGALVTGHITLSFGLAGGVPQQGQSYDELLAAADRALYQSKLTGRNQYHVAETWGNLP